MITNINISIPQLIAHISKVMTLEPGDFILTGILPTRIFFFDFVFFYILYWIFLFHSCIYFIIYFSQFLFYFNFNVFILGTPEGVGPLFPGEKIKAGITGLDEISFDVV